MANRRSRRDRKCPLVTLVVVRAEAQERIQRQIDEGMAILRRGYPQSTDDLWIFNEERGSWFDFTKELLLRLFSSTEISEEFMRSTNTIVRVNPNFVQKGVEAYERTETHVSRLRSIYERLVLIPDVQGSEKRSEAIESEAGKSARIFLVHGHDSGAKETVARFLGNLGLEVTILHEQPDKGRTIIEKFEDHANVGFAVILLTADDSGRAVNAPADAFVSRARQNVILEHGYFMGALGRTNVCALLQEGVEIPSDLLGILYIPFSDSGEWKFRLANEMKAAGVEVDLNKLA